MTKTPRTDEQLKLEAFFDGIGIVETVEVEFAQQLEAELADKDKQLADARAEIEHKNKIIEQMYEAIKFSLIADEVRQTRNVCASDINDACETSRIKRIAALSAAERGE